MTVTIDLAAYLRERKGLVEAALDARLPAADTGAAPIHAAMRYAALGGGKRLRPIFTLAIAELAGERPEMLLDAACALEFTHTASLILDDLPCMDNAQTRRGEPCTHLKFDKATALLATMALLSSAFDLVARNAVVCERPSAAATAVALLARALGVTGLVHGQHLDLAFTGKEASLETLEQIHHLKAGALFLAAIQIPATLLNMAEPDRVALECYARNIGLAFQITDDLLDAALPAEDAGKCTFVTHMGSAAAQERVRSLINEAIGILDRFGPRAEILCQLAEYVRARNV